MLDAAFDALKKYDWGTDMAPLVPIEDAATAAHDKPEVRLDLESRLIDALKGDLSRDAHDYVCRKLTTVGSSAAVPVLSVLVIKPENSHMARFALERITGPEAGQALRDALDKVSGKTKIGVISSLGARRESASILPLGKLLNDADPGIARAAALALGAIGSSESAATLQSAMQSSGSNQSTVIDALLSCAESLLTGNKAADANSIYKTLVGDSQPRLVRLAATRGLLACASKQA